MPGLTTSIRAVMSPLRGLLGPDAVGARQSLVALAVSALTATAAGVLLATFTDTLEEFPGLLVLVPAAIGMRGNIFGALGSRLATTIHTGTFGLSRRVDTVVGQNVAASLVLSLVTAVVLGAAVKVVATASGLDGTISLAALVTVSVIGSLLASVVVLVVALLLAASSARKGWDLDNVNAPLVSAVGDVVTLPALILASTVADIAAVTTTVSIAFAVLAVYVVVAALRSALPELVAIVRESLPILTGAGLVLALAGIIIEHRFAAFGTYPALLILVPSALGAAGALGGILASRLSSKLHLGVVDPSLVPNRHARRDINVTVAIALPVFVLNGVLAQAAASLFSFASPGVVSLIGVAVCGGMAATAFVVLVAYSGTVAAVRLGVDPDTYGIPLVTSVVDVIGALALVLAVAAWGLP